VDESRERVRDVDLAQEVPEAQPHDRDADQQQQQPPLDMHPEVEPLDEGLVADQAAHAARLSGACCGAASRLGVANGQALSCSLALMVSVSVCGFARPRVSRIACPTRNLSASCFPARYSDTGFGFASSTRSTIAPISSL